jgi:hypothetical protein
MRHPFMRGCELHCMLLKQTDSGGAAVRVVRMMVHASRHVFVSDCAACVTII